MGSLTQDQEQNLDAGSAFEEPGSLLAIPVTSERIVAQPPAILKPGEQAAPRALVNRKSATMDTGMARRSCRPNNLW